MIEKLYKTSSGEIRYWVNNGEYSNDLPLIFLPGLTADHRLFDQQISFFKDKYRVFVWDGPGHGLSWPFDLSFNLKDLAIWLDEILQVEGILNPLIVGQSFGGYIGQMYIHLFKNKIKGFVSIDSAPLQRGYYSRLDLWLLKRLEAIYKIYPWKALVKAGSQGVAVSDYGINLMKEMMMVYNGNQKRYSKLAGNGFKMLAEAIEEDLSYEINCPAILICGEEDKAGYVIKYNKEWHNKTGLPIKWIKDGGHNSNTDQPGLVNQIIYDFIQDI